MFVKIKTFHRKKIVAVFALCMAAMLFLIGRLGYLMLLRADYYSEKAQDLHERERSIKAARGKILDCNGKVLADNKTVCTISVIHGQIKEPEKVIDVLTEELGLERNQVKKRVEKNSSIERIKTNVDKQTGDKIREYDLAGVKVDEDYKRNYPYGNLASKVLGFTGSDNQGIVGLEVKYESILKGTDGQILTMTDARGVELSDTGEGRKEPVSGKNLILSLDANLQEYAQQAAYQALEQKQADSVSIILMRPGNGEILAMVNVPEYDLNDPFNLKKSTNGMSQQEIQDERNKMWRNGCINDTYEPGSTFKIITASAALEEGVANMEANAKKTAALRDRLIQGLSDIPHSKLNGDPVKRLPGNVNYSFEGVEGESLLLALDEEGIRCSSGSACTSESLDPSHVLMGMGVPVEAAHGSLRFSLNEENTEEEVDYIIEKVHEIVALYRKMSPFWEELEKGEREHVI